MFNNDELVLIACHIPLKTLFNFCLSCKRAYAKVWNNNAFWRRKVIMDFNREEEINLYTILFKEMKEKSVYFYILKLYEVKREWRLAENVYEIYYLKNINKTDNGIRRIPRKLCLPFLNNLFLGHNSIEVIPDDLYLPKLEQIYLHCNKIRTIPKNLKLPSLTHMQLSYNYIKEIPAELTLPELLYLTIGNNQVDEKPINHNFHPQCIIDIRSSDD